jgi:predicted Zn-dependent peptidase
VPHVAIERRRLPNGLRVILSRDRRAPIVAVHVWYGVGSRHEKPGRTGFAHLFEHMMTQGSAHVGKGQHDELVEAAGGLSNASTWLDRTNYFETLPSHELELALWLESDRLASLLPAITQEKLDNQRDVVKNERLLDFDNEPYGTCDEKMQEHLFPKGHPYHHPTIGSMEDLDAASLDDVREFFAAHYAPNNAVLAIAGDFDPDAVMALVEKHFGPIPANPSIPAATPIEIMPVLGAEARETIPGRVSLPRVYAAYRMPPLGSAGHDALQVVVDLLTSGLASRLYRGLVREQQVAQELEGYAFPFAAGASILMLSATARPDVEPAVVEAALWAEIDRLAADGPTDEELDRVRNLHAVSVESDLEHVGERAERLAAYAGLFDEPERINTEVSRYAAVDAARVMQQMAATMGRDNRAVLTYVPNGSDEGSG